MFDTVKARMTFCSILKLNKMKNIKKLNLQKINISKLNDVKGGYGGPGNPGRPGNPGESPTENPHGCGNTTNFLACQYTQTPMSRIVCV